MSKSTLLVIGFCVLAAGCTSSATTRPATQRATLATPAAATVTAGVSVTLSADQAATVRAYLHSAAPQTSRGRNGGLPPGIARNLARGKALPPGIAKTYLPGHIVTRLPSLPSGLDYIVVAGKLLLVEAATQVIRDVLLDIAFDG